MTPLTAEFIQKKIHHRNPVSHKGDYGHALFIGGSLGKIGAAVLASKACLRTGAGLLTSYVPACAKNIFPIAIPEAMTLFDSNNNEITTFPNTEKYASIGIGCGLGNSPLTSQAFDSWIKKQHKQPIVFDADALNILSQKKSLLKYVPEQSIFTPHIKEFERLAGKSLSIEEQIEKASKFSKKHTIFVVLKNHKTKLFCPNGTIFENTFGNAGMATAGSGDVLTGIILSLLAQGYQAEDAATIGIVLHSLAGDLAAKKVSEHALIASDIIENIGNTYLNLSTKK